MGYQRLNRQTRREQIAETALRIVGDQGMKGLSLAALARRVGIVPSAIYRHFKGKEELLDAILELFQKRVMANVQAVKEETGDPLEQMRRLLMRHVELIRENEALPRIIFSEDVHHRSSARRNKLLGIVKSLLGEVECMLKEGQRAGLVRKDLNPSTLALVFLGLFQPAAVLWHLSQGEFDVTRHAKRAWEVFKRGVEEKET